MRGFGNEVDLPELPASLHADGMNYPIPIVLAAGAAKRIEINKRRVTHLYAFVHNGGTLMMWFGTVPGIEDCPDMTFGPSVGPQHVRLSNYRGDFVAMAGNAQDLKATLLITDAELDCGCLHCDEETLAAALCKALSVRDEATANVGRFK